MRMNLKLAQDVRTLRPHLSDTERERIREDVEQLLSGKGSFPILDALPLLGHQNILMPPATISASMTLIISVGPQKCSTMS